MSLKSQVESLFRSAVKSLHENNLLSEDATDKVACERCRDEQHGDFASNIAMALAKQAKTNPRELATRIVESMPDSDLVDSIEIAGPGFINVRLQHQAYFSLLNDVLSQAQNYGRAAKENGQKVMVEFVSANPTGPLHVGHGRGAAFGDALARVLKAAGYSPFSEYYVNDAGRQMDILALSIWLRYLEKGGADFEFPENGYKGEYIYDIAQKLRDTQGENFDHSTDGLFDDLPQDTELRMDELIARCKAMLGDSGFRILFDCGRDTLVDDIREDLKEFGVEFDEWFSERSLLDNGDIQNSIAALEKLGHIYEKEGAKWFRATDFGDEKDRVVMRANGIHTYFASDVAYHYNKGERGFDKIINVFGADHHGYVTRVKAGFSALGHAPEKLDILLVQFAILYRGGEKVSMSTRSGEFVTLRDLRNEVGNDAARFFYVLRKPEQHMDFDLDLAKSQSNDNPVFYIQYAHARICSIFRQISEKGLPSSRTHDPDFKLLKEAREMDLIRSISKYPEVVALAANSFEPHQVAYYLRDLATSFHSYYNAHPIINSDEDLRLARLGLIDATRQVIANGLFLLGVSAPEQM